MIGPLNSDWLVGGIALVLAGVVGWSALTQPPWLEQLRSVAVCRRRWGQRVTCWLMAAVAAILVLLGLAIISGTRPGYALPEESPDESSPAHGLAVPATRDTSTAEVAAGH